MATAHAGRVKWIWAVFILAALAGCGGGSGSAPTLAEESDIQVIGSTQGINPFISITSLSGASSVHLSSVSYTITPRAGSASKPVSVSYTAAYLTRRGYLTPTSSAMTLPVFGLYDNSANPVSITLVFTDQSVQTLATTITTAPYIDPLNVYQHPIVNTSRSVGSALGFDFILLKSTLGPPVVIDTDGAVRWVGPAMTSSTATAYENNGFVVGSASSDNFTRVEWDGTTTPGVLMPSGYSDFAHNIDHGKTGLLGDLDTPTNLESTVVAFDDGGHVLASWDFPAILSNYMTAQGDDPSAFVRPGSDWFHLNSSTYDPSDDTIIASSRENFLIKVDYSTGNIVWILGDPTKYWYTFASLRAKALTVAGGGLYPIGQHSVTLTADGRLMVFNDGTASVSQPAGAPAGASRSYSAVSVYSIDATARTAQETWDYSDNQAIYSSFCSSAYQATSDTSLLIDYADIDNGTAARIVGLDVNHALVFDFQFASPTSCGTAWNAIPVPLDALALS